MTCYRCKKEIKEGQEGYLLVTGFDWRREIYPYHALGCPEDEVNSIKENNRD